MVRCGDRSDLVRKQDQDHATLSHKAVWDNTSLFSPIIQSLVLHVLLYCILEYVEAIAIFRYRRGQNTLKKGDGPKWIHRTLSERKVEMRYVLYIH